MDVAVFVDPKFEHPLAGDRQLVGLIVDHIPERDEVVGIYDTKEITLPTRAFLTLRSPEQIEADVYESSHTLTHADYEEMMEIITYINEENPDLCERAIYKALHNAMYMKYFLQPLSERFAPDQSYGYGR